MSSMDLLNQYDQAEGGADSVSYAIGEKVGDKDEEVDADDGTST